MPFSSILNTSCWSEWALSDLGSKEETFIVVESVKEEEDEVACGEWSGVCQWSTALFWLPFMLPNFCWEHLWMAECPTLKSLSAPALLGKPRSEQCVRLLVFPVLWKTSSSKHQRLKEQVDGFSQSGQGAGLAGTVSWSNSFVLWLTLHNSAECRAVALVPLVLYWHVLDKLGQDSILSLQDPINPATILVMWTTAFLPALKSKWPLVTSLAWAKMAQLQMESIHQSIQDRIFRWILEGASTSSTSLQVNITSTLKVKESTIPKQTLIRLWEV